LPNVDNYDDAWRQESDVVTNERDWTRKYKQALLERNPEHQILRVDEVQKMLMARIGEITETDPERRMIDRALDVLATLRESCLVSNSDEAAHRDNGRPSRPNR
jgi:RNA polymerase-interacting CarD/CdnL/TRCF family regulator